jgi:hypothetical protein
MSHIAREQTWAALPSASREDHRANDRSQSIVSSNGLLESFGKDSSACTSHCCNVADTDFVDVGSRDGPGVIVRPHMVLDVIPNLRKVASDCIVFCWLRQEVVNTTDWGGDNGGSFLWSCAPLCVWSMLSRIRSARYSLSLLLATQEEEEDDTRDERSGQEHSNRNACHRTSGKSFVPRG